MAVDQVSETIPDNSLLKKLWFWSVAIVVVVVLGGVWILFSRTITTEAITGTDGLILEPAPVAGHPAPNFELKSLEGQVINLSDFKGRPVLVNFWATWCGPCRAEMPDFQQVAVDNADKIVVIGINNTVNDTPELVGDFVDELGVTFTIILDEDGKTAQTYRVLGLPTTIFIDRNGIINEVFTGPINKAYIESKIPEL
jgi:thiol-disulfide isomerase/thioredoxin